MQSQNHWKEGRQDCRVRIIKRRGDNGAELESMGGGNNSAELESLGRGEITVQR